MLRRIGFCLLIAATAPVHPQPHSGPDWQTLGPVSGARALPNGLEAKAGGILVRIEALSPTVIRVRYARSGAFPAEGSFAVVPSPGFSSPSAKMKNSASSLVFDTGQLTVRIDKASARVAFLTPDGQSVSQDALSNAVSWSGAAFRVCKSMPEDEHYFGLGDKAGPLDHRNQAFVMWNTDAFGWQESTDPLYKSIPFFLAMRGGKAYGIFLDDTYRTSFDFGKEQRGVYCFGAENGELNYYFFYGPHPKKVIEEYTALTGRPPLPPLFVFGYQQSRYSYYPESRVRAIADEFRRRKIPADVLYLDIDYQDANRPFTVDRKKFPHFEEMIHDLGEQGFKVVAITDPHLKKEIGYRPYDEGIAHGYFLRNPDGTVYVGKVWPGDSVFPDFVRSDVRSWWGTLYSTFVKTGIRGFWNDMNEPAVFTPPPDSSKTVALDTVDSVDGRSTDQREIHNVYGMQNARATYEGLLKLQPNVRPFVLTRAAYAGTQRFALSWTGDNSSTWNHLRLSIPTLLNLGISGYAFVGDDIGGFFGSPNADLLTRWMEVGVFNPVYRNHTDKGMQDREPWVHGPEQEAIRRRFIEARYRLLPYIYTSAEETTRTGLPLMRPMFLEFPENSTLATLDHQYMFGDAFLVAPKLFETMDPYTIVLPEGTWYEYWTGKKIEGGHSITANPRLDELPVYVRGGAIVPHQPIVQTVDQPPDGPLELRVYPGPNCSGSLYVDDGNTFDFTRGAFQRSNFTCEILPDSLRVRIEPGAGSYKPWWHEIRVVIMGVAGAPCSIAVNGTALADWKYGEDIVSMSIPASADRVDIAVSHTCGRQ
jgi:alpha-glucosidase